MKIKNYKWYTSRFQIAIDVKTIIIGHVFFKQNFLYVGLGGNNILTNYYLFYVIIAIWELIVQYFSSYLHDKHCIFASILLINYYTIKGFYTSTNWSEKTMFSCQWLENNFYIYPGILYCIQMIYLSIYVYLAGTQVYSSFASRFLPGSAHDKTSFSLVLSFRACWSSRKNKDIIKPVLITRNMTFIRK